MQAPMLEGPVGTVTARATMLGEQSGLCFKCVSTEIHVQIYPSLCAIEDAPGLYTREQASTGPVRAPKAGSLLLDLVTSRIGRNTFLLFIQSHISCEQHKHTKQIFYRM